GARAYLTFAKPRSTTAPGPASSVRLPCTGTEVDPSGPISQREVEMGTLSGRSKSPAIVEPEDERVPGHEEAQAHARTERSFVSTAGESRHGAAVHEQGALEEASEPWFRDRRCRVSRPRMKNRNPDLRLERGHVAAEEGILRKSAQRRLSAQAPQLEGGDVPIERASAEAEVALPSAEEALVQHGLEPGPDEGAIPSGDGEGEIRRRS